MARHPLILAYGAALVPALVMALSQPVWSRIDEAQHADFILQLSHGVYPVADQTLIAPEILRVMQQTGVFRGAQPGTYPAPDLADLGLPPTGMSDSANAAWMSRHLWQLSFESVQTPGYYLLMVPVWLVADKLGGPFAAIYTLRVINALLIAALAPMAVAAARILAPGRLEVAALAAMFAILLPGLDLNATRISNDGLSAVLGGLAVLLVLRWAGRPWTWRRAVLLGLLLGAGLMVKLTLAGLIPALALAMLWPAPGPSWRQRIARAAGAGAIAVACLVPWFMVNLHLYGVLSPGTRAGRLSDAVPMPFTAPFIPFDLAVFSVTYWSGEPFGALPLGAPFAVLGFLVALMVVAAVIRMRKPALPLVVAIAAVGGLIAVALLLPATAGFEFAGPGRYAYPALPAAAALCAIGICTVLTRPFARRAISGLYGVAAVGILAAGAAGLPAQPQPGHGVPPAGLRIVSTSASGELHGMVITVHRVALDPGEKAVWVEVEVVNNNAGEAEWPVVPVATAGGAVAYGDYLRSTHLPGDIDAGQSVTGWLFVPLDPIALHESDTIHLRFPDVAVDGYAAVGDILVDVSIVTPVTGSACMWGWGRYAPPSSRSTPIA